MPSRARGTQNGLRNYLHGEECKGGKETATDETVEWMAAARRDGHPGLQEGKGGTVLCPSMAPWVQKSQLLHHDRAWGVEDVRSRLASNQVMLACASSSQFC